MNHEQHNTPTLAHSPLDFRSTAPALSPSAVMYWDGGERAITAREKATIEEHGPSSFSIALVPATPSSRWAADAMPDPHAGRYACERAALTLGNLTDDELANAVFLHGNEQPTMADLVAGKALSGIVYLTAAKDRIRWLSRALVDATCKQPLQVGEVQAYARAQFEAWARPQFHGAEVFDLIGGRPGGMEYNGNDEQAAWAGWQAAIASRQLVGKVPMGYIDPTDMARVERNRNDQGVCAVRVHLRITDEDMPDGSVPVYAAPPAQSIDLERALDIMWNWQEQLGGHVFDVRDVARTLTSSDMQAIGVDAKACADATDRNEAIVLAKREILRAFLASHRAAAPGVDRG